MLISKFNLVLLYISQYFIDVKVSLMVMTILSFGLVKSYNMPCTVESASLEPKYGFKFVAAGEDMWIRVFDFHTGEEIGMSDGLIRIFLLLLKKNKILMKIGLPKCIN